MLCATVLQRDPPQIRKKIIMASELRASCFSSGSFVMNIVKLFFNMDRTVIPYRVTTQVGTNKCYVHFFECFSIDFKLEKSHED